MKETIQIVENKDTNTWDARVSECDVNEILGTDTAPTAYTLAMPKDKVVAKIQALNPDCKVF